MNPSPEIYQLAQRDIWIFGGAGHLGKACVQLIAGLGARVLCVDLADRSAEFICGLPRGGDITPLSCDIRDVAGLRQVVAEQLRTRGTPHGLVNLTYASTAKNWRT